MRAGVRLTNPIVIEACKQTNEKTNRPRELTLPDLPGFADNREMRRFSARAIWVKRITAMLPLSRGVRRGAVVLLCGMSVAASTETGSPADWLSGAALENQLACPISISWSGVPFSDALHGLARAQLVAVIIDRRVDPSQKIRLTSNSLPLGETLGRVAQDRGLGVCRFGAAFYFGPPEVARRLRTIAALFRQDIRRLPSRSRQKLLEPKRIRWDDFATPRRLLTQLSEESGVKISGLKRVPHDLWAAADLPPLPLADQLTLIAVQFDLLLEVAPGAASLRLVSLPDDVALVRSYPAGHRPEELARKWAALLPDCQIEVVGRKIRVRGLLEDHERLASRQRLVGRPAAKSRPEATPEKRFTLREAKGSLGEMLEMLKRAAGQLQIEVRIDHRALRQAGISLDQRMSCSVSNATLDELISAVLEPAGLVCRRQDNLIEIRPAK